ncbi:MAG: ribonuclease III [Clostridiales bacterium]|nr:ribonuclease III [Clostridiales bacterium]
MEDCFLQAVLAGEKKIDPRQLSPLTLAFVGDAVFEIYARTHVLFQTGNAPVSKFNKLARGIVNAKAQAEMVFVLEELFTEEEKAVYRRGRNAKSYTMPKNADMMDYRHATGLEAVFGYLYLEGRMERLTALFQAGLQKKKS